MVLLLQYVPKPVETTKKKVIRQIRRKTKKIKHQERGKTLDRIGKTLRNRTHQENKNKKGAL